MSFGLYMILVTTGALTLRWLLFALYEQTGDGPSFLRFLLEPGQHGPDRFRLPIAAFVLGVGGIGMLYLD